MASGDQTITGTSGNDHLNGGSGSDTISGGAGNDFINGGSGSDILNGQSGSDRVDGNSGNDVLIYNMSENAGATDMYDGGSGIDTLRLLLTTAQHQSAAVQADLAAFQAFLNDNTLPNGQANNREFRFTAFDLRVSKIENLQIEIVDGANHAPVAVADTNGADAVIESGVNPGNTPFAGNSSATGNVLTNDTDVDAGDSKTVTAVNGSAANVGTSINGTYGSLTLGSNGEWTYTLHNADADTNALAQGEAATDVFTYTVSDAAGATSSTTLTINITGTNDQPNITGMKTGAVQEDGNSQATGQLNSGDPDHGAEDSWMVVGGSAPHAADYLFLVDNLKIVKNGGTIFEDTFGDGAAPPFSPNFTNGNPHTYGTTGTFGESRRPRDHGRNAAGPAIGVGTPDEFVGHFATVRSNIDPANTMLGLKIGDDFTVEGRFDLILPDDRREAYGIRLDRPADRAVPARRLTSPAMTRSSWWCGARIDGIVRVQLIETDFVADDPHHHPEPHARSVGTNDQIVLRLEHDNAGPGRWCTPRSICSTAAL